MSILSAPSRATAVLSNPAGSRLLGPPPCPITPPVLRPRIAQAARPRLARDQCRKPQWPGRQRRTCDRPDLQRYWCSPPCRRSGKVGRDAPTSCSPETGHEGRAPHVPRSGSTMAISVLIRCGGIRHRITQPVRLPTAQPLQSPPGAPQPGVVDAPDTARPCPSSAAGKAGPRPRQAGPKIRPAASRPQ